MKSLMKIRALAAPPQMPKLPLLLKIEQELPLSVKICHLMTYYVKQTFFWG